MNLNRMRWPQEFFARCTCGLRLSESFRVPSFFGDRAPKMCCPIDLGGCGEVSRWRNHEEYRQWREKLEGSILGTHAIRNKKVLAAEIKKAIEREQS